MLIDQQLFFSFCPPKIILLAPKFCDISCHLVCLNPLSYFYALTWISNFCAKSTLYETPSTVAPSGSVVPPLLVTIRSKRWRWPEILQKNPRRLVQIQIHSTGFALSTDTIHYTSIHILCEHNSNRSGQVLFAQNIP